MKQQSKFIAYRIPFLDELNQKNKEQISQNQVGSSQLLSIIGIIDASGSMSQCWGWLANFWNQSIPKDNLITITFSNNAKVSESNILSPNIKHHGGGSTEIISAFELFEQQLKKIPAQNNITVIFISDGQDNRVSSLDERMKKQLKGNIDKRNINFICLGIQSGFPTVLSMNLRKLYHDGDPQIPAIYLIEYASEQAFFNKFETMKKYFYPSKVLKLNRLVNLFPYDEQVDDEVYEGQWVISYEPDLKIISEEKIIDVQGINEQDLEIEDVIDLFRSWMQNLQIKSMQQNEMVVDEAKKCLEIMLALVDYLNQKLEMNILTLKQNDLYDACKPFHQRAREGFVYKYGNKIQFFVDEVTSISKGVNPKQMSEFEQAKRLNLGTITGKHYQKALSLKGISISEFQKMKEEFIIILKNCKFDHQNETGQEKSVVTLENQRDILADTKLLIEGLRYIKSQYDFAETFPLIGHAINVKRKEGCQVNPWVIQIDQFAHQHKIIDSGYLIKKKFNIELDIGQNQKEVINCILPLFHESDSDLKPILRSRIMKLLMTFMVQQNVDTYYEETYLALLSNALIYLYTQQKSQWVEKTIDLIYSTIKIVYQGTDQFEKYLEKLILNPTEAYLKQEEEYENFVSPDKPFIYYFYAIRMGGLIDNFETAIERLMIYTIYRQNKKNPDQLANYFEFHYDQEEKVFDFLRQKFSLYSHLNSFKNSLNTDNKEAIMQIYKNQISSLSVAEGKLYNPTNKFNFNILEKFYHHVSGKDFDKSRYIHLVYHTLTTNEENLFTTAINYQNIHQIQSTINTHQNSNQKNQLAVLNENLSKEYLEIFKKTHKFIQPLTYEQLQINAQIQQQDVKLINYNQESGLANNCCFAKECPFYFKILSPDDFRKHMQNWTNNLPLGFHTFVVKKINENLSISDIMEQAKIEWPNFPDKYNENPNMVKEYINLIEQYMPKNYKAILPDGQNISSSLQRSASQIKHLHKQANKANKLKQKTQKNQKLNKKK